MQSINLCYGKKHFSATWQEDQDVIVLSPDVMPLAGSETDCILHALKNPITSAPLFELVAKS